MLFIVFLQDQDEHVAKLCQFLERLLDLKLRYQSEHIFNHNDNQTRRYFVKTFFLT
jgi:hypothetical protein